MPTETFSIKIQNNSAVNNLLVELFYGMYSMFDIKKPTYAREEAGFAYNPIERNDSRVTQFDNFQLYALSASVMNGTLSFNNNGDGIITGNVAGPVDQDVNNYVSIVCSEVPYRTVLEYSKLSSFCIKKMRINANTQEQLFNPFDCIQKTLFGNESVKTYKPQQFFTPTNFQPLIVDINKPYTIDRTKGFRFDLNAVSYLNIVFDIEY